jgi:hypothetical protein
MSTPPKAQQAVAFPDQPERAGRPCAGCDRPLKFLRRGRGCTIWECQNPDCPVSLVDVLDPLPRLPERKRRRGTK